MKLEKTLKNKRTGFIAGSLAALSLVFALSSTIPASAADMERNTDNSGYASSTERTRRPNETVFRSWNPASDESVGFVVVVKPADTHGQNYDVIFKGERRDEGVLITDDGNCVIPGPRYGMFDSDKKAASFVVLPASEKDDIFWFSGILRMAPKGMTGDTATATPFLLAWDTHGVNVKFLVGREALEALKK